MFLQRRGRRRRSGLGLLPAHVLERTAQVPLALLAVALVVQDLVLAAGYLLNGAAAQRMSKFLSGAAPVEYCGPAC